MTEQAAAPSTRLVLPLLLTAAMALSMLPLFLLGALGPYLVDEFGIPARLLGLLVTVGFAISAVLSLVIGPAVGGFGARRALVAMFGVSAVVLAGIAVAPGYGWLLAAIAVSGVAQALANPATNQLIATRVPPRRRAGATGLKQSGVQLGAFVAGLPLAAIAAAWDWRLAVGISALAALLLACAVFALASDGAPPRLPRLVIARAGGDGLWLAVFSVLLGAGISAVNTYVTLFASRQLGMATGMASGLVAVLGVAGIVGRIGWARVAGRGRPGALLAPLALGAVMAALALAVAPRFGVWWVWAGVLGIGLFAMSANAVSMVTVIARAGPDQVGRVSAVVSAGFFAGFAIGPTALGALADAAGGRFEWGWSVVAAEFLGAAAVAWWWHRRSGRA